MGNIVRVKNIQFRDALMNHTDGETVYCEEEKQCFVWSNGAYQPVSSSIDSVGEIKVNYRDLVISAISSFDPLDEEQLIHQQMLINSWDEYHKQEFYMLYGREFDYFTLFHWTGNEKNKCLGKEVLECLNNVGSLIYVEEFANEDKNIVFWIKGPEGKITEVYLFDYNEGVVPFI